jgi:hypothetical protein
MLKDTYQNLVELSLIKKNRKWGFNEYLGVLSRGSWQYSALYVNIAFDIWRLTAFSNNRRAFLQ